MKVVFDAFRDKEVNVWVATAREDGVGIATEAETVEALQKRLALIVPDYFETPASPFEIVLHVDLKSAA